MPDSMVIGTTAPFSAMSGAWMDTLPSVREDEPMAALRASERESGLEGRLRPGGQHTARGEHARTHGNTDRTGGQGALEKHSTLAVHVDSI
jgi:hypothetical protein